jgi:hypothetical protein
MSNFLGANLAMEQAAAHADRVHAEWRETALKYFRAIAMVRREFATEDVRLHAEGQGFPKPPDPRAWGAVQRAAAAEEYIQPTGRWRWSTSPTRNACPVALWASLIYVLEN